MPVTDHGRQLPSGSGGTGETAGAAAGAAAAAPAPRGVRPAAARGVLLAEVLTAIAMVGKPVMLLLADVRESVERAPKRPASSPGSDAGGCGRQAACLLCAGGVRADSRRVETARSIGDASANAATRLDAADDRHASPGNRGRCEQKV